MRHDWIFDVLRDLKTYAQSNGLPGLAQKADEALRMARAETAVSPLPEAEAESPATAPGRAH